MAAADLSGTSAAPRRRRSAARVYLPVAAIALAIAISGFWPTYFGPLVTGTLQTIPMIHVHAAVFVGWLLLVGLQSWLAATGRIRLHRQVGEFGMYWGLLVIVVAVATAFVVFDQRVDAGRIEEARNRLFVPLTDILVFVPFFAAAWLFKDRPELHKRLIIVATTVLLIAAVHRITFLGPRPRPPALLLVIWLAPIYIAMVHDWVRTRRVHVVYLLGILAVLFLKFGRLGMARSETWRNIAGYFTSLYAA